MGRKSSNDLFRLIQSLNASEKQQIEQHTARHKKSAGNLYRKLFQVISSQTAFDNEQLKADLGRKISNAHLIASQYPDATEP
jgi:phosphopantetheinyl transferase